MSFATRHDSADYYQWRQIMFSEWAVDGLRCVWWLTPVLAAKAERPIWVLKAVLCCR
jgi:hypothetical protein